MATKPYHAPSVFRPRGKFLSKNPLASPRATCDPRLPKPPSLLGLFSPCGGWMRCLSVVFIIVIWPLLASAQTSPATDVDRLRQLFQKEWEYTLEQNPTWASELG